MTKDQKKPPSTWVRSYGKAERKSWLQKSQAKYHKWRLQEEYTLLDLINYVKMRAFSGKHHLINKRICTFTGGGTTIKITIPTYLYKTILAHNMEPSLFMTLAAEDRLREYDMLDHKFPALPGLTSAIVALVDLEQDNPMYRYTEADRNTRLHRLINYAYAHQFLRHVKQRTHELDASGKARSAKVLKRIVLEAKHYRKRRFAGRSNEDWTLGQLKDVNPDAFWEWVKDDPEMFNEWVKDDPEFLETLTDAEIKIHFPELYKERMKALGKESYEDDQDDWNERNRAEKREKDAERARQEEKDDGFVDEDESQAEKDEKERYSR